MLHTRLDFTYIVSVISQFIHNSEKLRLQAICRVCTLLEGNTWGVMFKRNNRLLIEICTDVDYAGPIVDKRFTIGYYFLGVIWSSGEAKNKI